MKMEWMEEKKEENAQFLPRFFNVKFDYLEKI